MQPFLAILLIAAMVGTVFALIRGIVLFLRTTQADLDEQASGQASGAGPSARAMRSNRMMQARVLLQAIAIFLVALMALFASRS